MSLVGYEFWEVISPHTSDVICRCDAKARAGCGSLRGVPLLQTCHPEGFDRADFDDCATKGESVNQRG